MTHTPVLKFRFPFDKELLLKEYEQVKDQLVPYLDGRYLTPANNWLVVRDLREFNLPYVKNITLAVIKTFGITGHVSPHFYFLQKRSILRNHVDLNTKCAINHIIQGEGAAVNYPEYGTFTYETALLDTTKIHGVINKDEDRLLFKISIFDEDFGTVGKRIHDSGHSL